MSVETNRAAGDRSGQPMQLKLSLRGVVKPPVWRRLLVPADIRLGRLHEVIQTAIGWTDTHHHVFSTRSGDYGVPDLELGDRNERNARLAQFLQQPGDRIHYSYDFGDGWERDIVLEKRLNPEPGVQMPACLAGKGACPPEDCGGPWGYADVKEALADPRHEDHEGMLDWLGLDSREHFDPTACDLAEINEVTRPNGRHASLTYADPTTAYGPARRALRVSGAIRADHRVKRTAGLGAGRIPDVAPRAFG